MGCLPFFTLKEYEPGLAIQLTATLALFPTKKGTAVFQQPFPFSFFIIQISAYGTSARQTTKIRKNNGLSKPNKNTINKSPAKKPTDTVIIPIPPRSHTSSLNGYDID